MDSIFKNHLFNEHILVNEKTEPSLSNEDCLSVLMTLAGKFGIMVTHGAALAQLHMIKDAQYNIGEYVPEPFYRGFPDSVREMTPNELFYDQMLHYTHTYGLGWWEEPGHSVLENLVIHKTGEEVLIENTFQENVKPKHFVILDEFEAFIPLKQSLRALLSSNRPLNSDQLDLVLQGYKTFGKDILPKNIPCKSTLVYLLYQTKDVRFCRYMKLSDVIKLLEYIQYSKYSSDNLKKLNLKNQDRKFITLVIDSIEFSNHDYIECFEKRKIWCGLLHHIHYKPKIGCSELSIFINDIRSNRNISAYSVFEEYMSQGKPVDAARYLSKTKGGSALVRNLNYVLSRCNETEVEEVLKWVN